MNILHFVFRLPRVFRILQLRLFHPYYRCLCFFSVSYDIILQVFMAWWCRNLRGSRAQSDFRSIQLLICHLPSFSLNNFRWLITVLSLVYFKLVLSLFLSYPPSCNILAVEWRCFFDKGQSVIHYVYFQNVYRRLLRAWRCDALWRYAFEWRCSYSVWSLQWRESIYGVQCLK